MFRAVWRERRIAYCVLRIAGGGALQEEFGGSGALRIAYCVLRIAGITARGVWRERRIAYYVLRIAQSHQSRSRLPLIALQYHQSRGLGCVAHCVLRIRIAYSSCGMHNALRIAHAYCVFEVWGA